MPIASTDSYGDMVTHDLSCYHGDGFWLGGIHFTWKNHNVHIMF